jgi:hypothetical protein
MLDKSTGDQRREKIIEINQILNSIENCIVIISTGLFEIIISYKIHSNLKKKINYYMVKYAYSLSLQ